MGHAEELEENRDFAKRVLRAIVRNRRKRKFLLMAGDRVAVNLEHCWEFKKDKQVRRPMVSYDQ